MLSWSIIKQVSLLDTCFVFFFNLEFKDSAALAPVITLSRRSISVGICSIVIIGEFLPLIVILILSLEAAKFKTCLVRAVGMATAGHGSRFQLWVSALCLWLWLLLLRIAD